MRKLMRSKNAFFEETEKADAKMINSEKETEKINSDKPKIAKETRKDTVFGFLKPKPVSLPQQYDQAKYQEIISNLKTVLAVSLLCLIIVGILYYWELKMDWVFTINQKIKDSMTGLSW